MDELDPKERTKKMREQARQQQIEHEKISRANQGKSQFPLRSKLMVALPLFALVIGIYGISMKKIKRNFELYKEAENEHPVITDVRELIDEEVLSQDLRDTYAPTQDQGVPGENLTDSDNKWTKRY